MFARFRVMVRPNCHHVYGNLKAQIPESACVLPYIRFSSSFSVRRLKFPKLWNTFIHNYWNINIVKYGIFCDKSNLYFIFVIHTIKQAFFSMLSEWIGESFFFICTKSDKVKAEYFNLYLLQSFFSFHFLTSELWLHIHISINPKIFIFTIVTWDMSVI